MLVSNYLRSTKCGKLFYGSLILCIKVRNVFRESKLILKTLKIHMYSLENILTILRFFVGSIFHKFGYWILITISWYLQEIKKLPIENDESMNDEMDVSDSDSDERSLYKKRKFDVLETNSLKVHFLNIWYLKLVM